MTSPVDPFANSSRNIFDVQRTLAAIFVRSELTVSGPERPLTRIRRQVFKDLSLKSNPVVGVGIWGIDGRPTEVHLMLRSKSDLDIRYLSGNYGAAGVTLRTVVSGPNQLTRPAQGGQSLGDVHGMTGTLGCVVEDIARAQLILSCNHVIAGENAALLGDDVWQPGKNDGGTSSSTIGTLRDFKRIDFTKPNEMDAAIASIGASGSVSTAIGAFGGKLKGYTATIAHNTSVEKVGWKTKHTKGTLAYKHFSLLMPFAVGNALFEDQYGIIGSKAGSNFSDLGDSGAVVVNSGQEVVGLLFGNALGLDLTFASPIEPILSHFAITIA